MAKCFRCKNEYDSANPDDIAGDGKCDACKQESARIALRVDVQMGERRKVQTISRLDELGIGKEGFKVDLSGRIIDGAGTPQINMRNLGVVPNE